MRAVLLGLLAAALLTESVDAQSEDFRSANFMLPGCQAALGHMKASGVFWSS
jgi:hypothetical protein